jgi:hypothetical protein
MVSELESGKEKKYITIENRDFAEKKEVLHEAESCGLVFQLRGSMATSLRVEDRLDGAANLSSWKERIVLLL